MCMRASTPFPRQPLFPTSHLCRHDRTRHIEAHHFCTHRSPELHQCVIYDGDGEDARLIGIEYIVNEKVSIYLVVEVTLSTPLFWQVFEALPPGEKQFWHSHKYEVRHGDSIQHHTKLAFSSIYTG